MAIRAVYFDIGGILEITPDTGWQKKWDPTGAVNQEELELIWRAGAVGWMSIAEVEKNLAALFKLDADAFQRFSADMWADYLGTPNIELMDYFRALRPRMKTGIISNSFVGATEREEAAYAFSSMCDHVVYSHEVGIEKPDPRIFHLALERLGVEAAEAVFLDDVQTNVAAARAVGMKAVLFESNAQAIATIDAYLLVH
jgi:putative hydrolase of the HAD superfamily